MLTPDFLENCADDIVRLYAKLDESITRDIARRICKTGFVTDTADWQAQMLAYSGRVFDDVIEDVAEYSDISSDRLRELFKNSIKESMKYDSQIYALVGKSLRLSEVGLQVLNAGFLKTNGDLKNLTMTTANTSQTAYINACTLAEMQITSGAFSYTTAIKNAIKSAIEQGTEVLYPSGHKDKLDVAVRRSVMTGVSQTAGKVSLQNAIDMDCDLMEITAHSGARPSHADWQGKIVSLSGRKGYLSTSDIGYGDGAGFKGWNCRHDWFPFFEGISKPNYTQKELDALQAKDTEYNGEMYTEYEASQMQRKQEREIRATRRELAGLDEAIKNAPNDEIANALKEDFQKASVKLKNQENKLKDFCNQTGLPNEKDRIQVYGFGKSTSQKAVQANKKYLNSVANSQNGGIIKEKPDIKLGEFASKLEQGHIDELKKRLSNAPIEIQHIWNKYVDDIKIINLNSNSAYYSPRYEGIYFNIVTVSQPRFFKEPYSTIFHESGHNIDNLVNKSNGGYSYQMFTEKFVSTKHSATLGGMITQEANERVNALWNTMKAEAKARGQKATSAKKSYAQAELRKELKALEMLASTDISDMFEGATGGAVYAYTGHGKAYWKTCDVGIEAFAEMFDATINNAKSLEQIKHYFPKSYEIFEEMLKVMVI